MINKIIFFIQAFFIAIITIIFSILGILLLPFGRNNAIYISAKIWSILLLKICGVKCNILGLKNIKKYPVIYISNHQSLIDIPLLYKALPIPLFFVAKKELKKVPFMGWFMSISGMIFIDRLNRKKAVESIKKAGDKIKNGQNIISFPEGSRSVDGNLQNFKKGTFMIAKKNNIEIVPIILMGAEKIISKNKFKINAVKINVYIGKSINPKKFETAKELSNNCKNIMLEMIKKHYLY